MPKNFQNQISLKKSLGLVLVLLTVWSCNPSPPEGADYNKIKKEVKSRKIIHISDYEIRAQAMKAGQIACDSLLAAKVDKMACGANIKTILPEGLKPTFLKCIIDCNEAKSKNNKINEVWKAYLEAFNKSLSLDINLQKISSNEFLYSYPIINNETSQFKLLNLTLSKKEIVKQITYQ